MTELDSIFRTGNKRDAVIFDLEKFEAKTFEKLIQIANLFSVGIATSATNSELLFLIYFFLLTKKTLTVRQDPG